MTFEKIVSIDEIDEIIPMIKKLHEGMLEKYISLTGFISWLALTLPLATFNIWKLVHEGKVCGYVVVEISQRYFTRECTIIDAYTEINDEECIDELWEHINKWAKENGCKILSCQSPRSSALARKYDFDQCGAVLMKRIGE